MLFIYTKENVEKNITNILVEMCGFSFMEKKSYYINLMVDMHELKMKTIIIVCFLNKTKQNNTIHN